ncbi:MAG: hypothetical protein KAW41_02065 [Candidatus Diapherotrites archaeon]|nr:hypothetical protein [Candidatus Diapherotrites archaeon]
MRRLLLLLLVSSIAMAQCAELAADVESGMEQYLGIDSVDCRTQQTENIYDGLAQLAEGYSQVAQCYKEQEDASRASAFYFLAAKKYRVAADALCERDYSLKMQLYLSSGDMYFATGDIDSASELYGEAEEIYSLHSPVIDDSINAQLQRRLYEMEYSAPPAMFDPRVTGEVDWAPIAAVVVLIVGLALVVITIVRKR